MGDQLQGAGEDINVRKFEELVLPAGLQNAAEEPPQPQAQQPQPQQQAQAQQPQAQSASQPASKPASPKNN